MQHESDDEQRLIVRVQTTVYRRDYPELWDRLQGVPAKRRGAALMAAMHRALAFEQAARALGTGGAPAQVGNAVATQPNAQVRQVGDEARPPGRASTGRKAAAEPLAPVESVSPDVAAVASAFTGDALAAFTSVPAGVS